jgi:ABC-2 type transport system ATP-binding protein
LFQAAELPPDLDQYGLLVHTAAPKVTLQIERQEVAQRLSQILDAHLIDDVSVEDPPLEEVIAQLFSQVRQKNELGVV